MPTSNRTPRKTRARTLRSEWLRACEVASSLVDQGTGFDRYYDDPVAFAREELHFEPWAKQQEVMRAVVEHNAVTNPAGRAVGKSRLDSALALWFAFTRPGSRVIFTAPTYKQVQETLWEEIRRVALHKDCRLQFDMAKRANTGIRTANGSQILGITAESPEAFQGIRAAELMVIADEASGISEDIFHVLEGNMAGGAKFLMTGNPTKSRGYFRESMRQPEHFHCVHISSLESPNVVAGEIVVPGLATQEFVEKHKILWGEDSALYKIHVLGEVVEGLEGQLFPSEMVAAAKAAWPSAKPTGRLVVGVDPAGAGNNGDESGFAARRGRKVLQVSGRHLKHEQDHLIEVLGLIALCRGDSDELPLIVVDRDGDVGARVYGILRSYVTEHEGAFQLIGIRGGERAQRKPLVYDRVRDEIWFGCVDAFRDGLAIPEDLKLERDLSEIKADINARGFSKVTPKDDLRQALDGRSPDRGDALSLCCFEIREWQATRQPAEHPTYHNPYIEPRARDVDPYTALDVWGGR